MNSEERDDPNQSQGAEPPEQLPPVPDRLAPVEDSQLRERVVQQAQSAKRGERDRPLDLRMHMMRSFVTEPLLSKVQLNPDDNFDVIIVLNELYEGGIPAALEQLQKRASELGVRYSTVSHYCFACLTGRQILALAEEARQLTARSGRSGSVLYRIWEDSDVNVSLTRSLTTVKADAAQRAFQALGAGVVWAVLDSGIDGAHPHFRSQMTVFGPLDPLNVRAPVQHMDFTPDGREYKGEGNSALVDRLGHGSHVAGIISGFWKSPFEDGEPVAGTEMRDEMTNEPVRQREKIRLISGVAPKAQLLSLKVIADVNLTGKIRQSAGQGKVSWVLMAIDRIQEWNQHGRRLLVHGVNMSLGYDFDPRWFGCGQSPICVEVNRLVKSGVSVVVSAGNAGYGSFITASGQALSRFSELSINDPGNAELAVTVGSTHKEMPHTYGVSYFSSRGPTGDGRLKPDLLAPGERIISCAAGVEAMKYQSVPDPSGSSTPVLYCEQTGTSMAAPHVSGSIAAFLSVRPEFIGQPEKVKEIFMNNTVDLKRERCFQGTGLLDLMKVLQAV